jgi:tetratricopeptide (TPR) repeat protein
MADGTAKPVIFISYSHTDEPEHPRGEEVQWLSFVRTYLQPAVKYGVFDLWVDQNMPGGTEWDPEIEAKLHACDIFILLVSANSMASDYIVEREIKIIRERQEKGDPVHFYPLLLTPTPRAGLDKVKDKNLRPRDAKPFSGYSFHDRAQHMTDAADEIAALVEKIANRKITERPVEMRSKPAYVHITGLPETAYERLVGRDDELKRLDDAWTDDKTNILSLVAEGGAGKSALVNEWLKRLQADNYRGAEAVLGWSFYSQGTKERATSADEFLNWALDKLGIKLETTSATAKGEAIAEVMMRRHVLLVLDGVEPLQHGLDTQLGQLKDQGLRALLRRFATTPPAQANGLMVLTSRLAVKDIARWQDSAAPVVDVERLSDEAGAALLRDNSVWGIDMELKVAAHDFGGHPLALGLLASFLKETQTGDVRRRDHIRAYFADSDNPRHDHAKRVMESYEKEWLVGKPVLLAMMHMVGLFDRPASGECFSALRKEPAITGLTDQIVKLDDGEWQRAVARLREVRLLAPPVPTAPDSLDTHPLVREWFGERLRRTNETAWKVAHGRLYEHLKDTTNEGKTPSIEDLAPLYQAIAHGCRAGRHQEALAKIFIDRICRRLPNGTIEFFAGGKLGAIGSDLAAISWFFEKPYKIPVATLRKQDQSWVLGEAGFRLSALGRLVEALPAMHAALQANEERTIWRNAAICSSNVSETELRVGEVAAAETMAKECVVHAERSGDEFTIQAAFAIYAAALHASGKSEKAERLFADAERRHRNCQPKCPYLESVIGYYYCDLLLSKGHYTVARNRAVQTLELAKSQNLLLDIALDNLTIGRADFALAVKNLRRRPTVEIGQSDADIVGTLFDQVVDGLRASGDNVYIPSGLLARAALCRSVGDCDGAARDLDEIEEIAEPGPMRLYLCDMALERARLAFARIEAFAPLNGMLEKDDRPKPAVPSAEQIAELKSGAEKQIKIAADYIEKCGYHRRDEELAELQAVLCGEKKFADLPPRV